jgi:hypothetical protein
MESWKEKALAAADAEVALKHNAERLQKEAERAKQVEAFQSALSGLLEEDIEVNALEITVDGVTFHWQYEYIGKTHHIVVQGTCPDCGKPAWSHPIRSLAHLGRQLQQFSPESDHVSDHVKDHLNTPQVEDSVRTTPIPGNES